MKNLKITAIALLLAALPLAPAAFAKDQDHDRHESARPGHGENHGDRDDRWGHGRGHEYRHNHHYRHHDHGDHYYRHGYYRHHDSYRGWDNHRAQITLPFPPLPVFVVPKQHKGHIILR